MKQIVLATFIFLIAIGLSSCATGSRFNGAATPPSGKAIVYIFRKRTMLGSAGMFNVYANHELIVKIKSGGYFPYVAHPGDLFLSHETAFGFAMVEAAANDRMTHSKDNVLLHLHVEPNHVYYVEWRLGGAFSGPTMRLSSPSEARSIIAGCSLLQAAHE